MIFVPRVLVVEDSPSFRTLLLMHLDALGADAVAVDDVGAAIATLEREAFDLVLSDHHLPNGTGLDLLAYVWHRFPELPLVLMSAVVDRDLRERGALADAIYDKDALLGALPTLVAAHAVAA
jgi:two-component system, NtrC family, response regulator PilR